MPCQSPDLPTSSYAKVAQHLLTQTKQDCCELDENVNTINTIGRQMQNMTLAASQQPLAQAQPAQGQTSTLARSAAAEGRTSGQGRDDTTYQLFTTPKVWTVHAGFGMALQAATDTCLPAST